MTVNKKCFFFLFFQAADVISIHESLCPSAATHKKEVQLSCDGVQESLSTTVTLDVYSIKFDGCKKIYPLRVIKPLRKVTIDPIQQLKSVVDDIYMNKYKISQFIGDQPKRSNARQCLCFSSWYPCEFCFAKGTKIITNSAEKKKEKDRLSLQIDIVKEKINSVKESGSRNNIELTKLKRLEKELVSAEQKIKPKKSNIVWPKTSMNGPPRTREEITEIIEKIENNVPLSIDEAKGIKGRSILFDLPGFNFVNNVSVEYLHVVCLGTVKKCVELTFRVGETRPRITKRKLSLPSQFNAQIWIILVPREFNRRIRELDFSVYKGQEFRNLVLFFFPLILNCIEVSAKERHLWLFLAYMIRSCVIPSEEFKQFPLDVLDMCTSSFYSLYEQLFGVKNCPYTIHVVGSHLIEMRFHGPLTKTSAFPFESFYGEMRNSFVPGTPSTLKQIFTNIFVKRVLSDHKCQNDMYISAKNTPMERNNLIYTFEQNTYTMYVVNSIQDDYLTCQVQDKKPCSFPETPTLNWSIIGVFEKKDVLPGEIVIHRSHVKGKVLIVNQYLLTCPLNVLQEK